MKLSEYIEHLQKIQARLDSDPQVAAEVTDYFSRYGSSATMKIDAGASMGGGYRVNDSYIVLNVHLTENYEGKHPKVMFRK